LLFPIVTQTPTAPTETRGDRSNGCQEYAFNCYRSSVFYAQKVVSQIKLTIWNKEPLTRF